MIIQPFNPPLDQDRAFDLYDTYKKYGYVMFPQQRRIYEQIAERVKGKSVLEVGCGNGVGSAVLERAARRMVMTDKLVGNVQFAKQLYPWVETKVLDVCRSISTWADNLGAQAVVAVEVLEHVADPVAALKNMLAWATEEVWFSTPNGKGKPQPPSNPHHVCEFTTDKVVEWLQDLQPFCTLQILGWEDFQPVKMDTNVDPLVYHVSK